MPLFFILITMAFIFAVVFVIDHVVYVRVKNRNLSAAQVRAITENAIEKMRQNRLEQSWRILQSRIRVEALRGETHVLATFIQPETRERLEKMGYVCIGESVSWAKEPVKKDDGHTIG